MDISTARNEFLELGFDPFPLKPGMKDPYSEGWQRRDILRLWNCAPKDANIGLRGGGEVQAAFLDCDEEKQEGTFNTAVSWLAGLGYLSGDYPVVQTASQVGRQIYVSFSGGLPDNWRKLADDFGEGEFRYGPGSMVVAPPSQVSGVSYALVDGDYRHLPHLELVDVLEIIKNKDTTTKPEKPSMPRRAMGLLHGKHIESFQSRSEAEQSLIVSLVNAGHSFESILDLFERYPCAGKFAEMRHKSHKEALRWLRHSYDNARLWTQTHESKPRQFAQAALKWAHSSPWPGKTGAVDRIVFIAHALIALKASRLTYAASSRDLAELSGISHMTASRASIRLSEKGLLILINKAVADCASTYQLNFDFVHNVTLPHNNKVRECNTMQNHDAFRWTGLGKSACEVYQMLQVGASTEEELTERSGRHISTIRRVLKQMTNLVDTVTGEIIEMVEFDGERWNALDVDLDLVARIVGTAGTLKRQQMRHRAERRVHQRSLISNRDESNT